MNEKDPIWEEVNERIERLRDDALMVRDVAHTEKALAFIETEVREIRSLLSL
jgi:hypothetical protein